MSRIVFLLEEPSMQVLLDGLLPRLFPEFNKRSGARRMARHLTRERNRSSSFRALMEGIEAMGRALINAPQGRSI